MKSYPLLIMLLFSILSSCRRNIKFEKSQWSEKNSLDSYPYRKYMLKDLLTTKKLKGLHYSELLDLLGEPEKYSSSESNVVFYNIVKEHSLGIDPTYLKHLKVYLDRDSVTVRTDVIEIKK